MKKIVFPATVWILFGLKMEVLTSDNESTSDESTSSSSIISKKLLTCEVCSIKEAKYTCPRCEVRTCCLKCSSVHKTELHCNGIRDSTKFIPIRKFTNIDFASDYRFLEQITKNVESYKKGVQSYSTERKYVPKRFWLLQRAAEKRKIGLKFLPNNFVRHKQNSTRFDIQDDKLTWLVEWIFVLNNNFKIQEKNVSEDVKLSEILQKYFVKQEDSSLFVQDKLQYYQSAGLARVKLFLKAEQISGNKYYELDLDENLKVNLCDKIIIEYPIIHVMLMEHSSCYELVKDGDKELNLKGVNVVNEIIMKAESDESIYKSMKNLLFVSDMSEEENEAGDLAE